MPMQLPIISMSVFRVKFALKEKVKGANIALKSARMHVVSSLRYEMEMKRKKAISIAGSTGVRYFTA